MGDVGYVINWTRLSKLCGKVSSFKMAAVTKYRNFLMVDFCFILSQNEHKF